MSIPDPRAIPSDVSRGPSHGRVLGLLRSAALMVVAAGAAGSTVMMLRAGQRTPRFLLALFIVWVLSPFAALAWANLVSRRWSASTRAALYGVTFVLTLSSLAIYADVVPVKPAGAANAFLWVIVPPASWALMAVVASAAAFAARRR